MPARTRELPRLRAFANVNTSIRRCARRDIAVVVMMPFRPTVLLVLCAAFHSFLLALETRTARATEDAVAVTPVNLAISGRDLAVEQVRQGECVQGKDCAYVITVTNMGPDRFSGMVNVLRTANYEPSKHKSPDGISCSRNGSAVACRTPEVKLEAGQSVAFELSLTVPQTQSGEVELCASLSFQGGEFEDPFEDLVAIVQLAMRSRGLYVDGTIDGKIGKKLRAAIDAFRAENGLSEGEIDAALIKALFGPAGLMAEDTAPGNDHVCDRFELAEPAVANTNRRNVRRRYVRRGAVRRLRTSGFASPNSVGRKNNHRLEGFE